MNLDAKVNNEVTRNDYAAIIALNRSFGHVVANAIGAHSDDDLKAGTVMGRVTASGHFAPYDDGASDGSEVAVAVLFEDVKAESFPAATGSTAVARGIFGGWVYQDKLTGFDANAKTDLGGKTIVDASGINILKF